LNLLTSKLSIFSLELFPQLYAIKLVVHFKVTVPMAIGMGRPTTRRKPGDLPDS